MNIACLCPSYGTPKLISNAIAQFERQDYPTSQCKLVVLDDSGCIQSYSRDNWSIVSFPYRLASLPEKYNLMAECVGNWADAFVVWEVDDIYRRHHIRACSKALANREWCHPRYVGSLYTGTYQLEPATGRFHAALGFRAELLERLGGWPDTRRADFDQQLIQRLHEEAGEPGHPDDYMQPSYVFRWASTGAIHGQGFMRAPHDETWWDRVPRPDCQPGTLVEPRLDDETQHTYERLSCVP